MADNTTSIERLERALGRGELTVEADGRRITYRSTADLLAALNYLKATSSTAAAPSAVTLASFERD